MRDYLVIIWHNLFSPIVIAILVLACALLYVGDGRDAWFISVVIVVNSIISIVQEVRAKYALRKLELMSAPRARVVRDDSVESLLYTQLRVDDEVLLSAGDEIPADGIVVLSKGLEINESMLTGESHAIDKQTNDTVYAATSVVAGSGQMKVTAVGGNTKAGAINATLKRYTPTLTPLQHAIQRAITWLTYGAVGAAVLIFIRYKLAGLDSVSILKTIVTGAIAIVPEGLLLASSLLLAFGSLRLAQVKVLPQKLSAIEAMGLLEVLCVDKTGTLTDDSISLDSVEVLSEKYNLAQAKDIAAMIAKETSGDNATGRAILESCSVPKKYETKEVLAFSSARKYAGLTVVMDGKKQPFLMGAPEYVSKYVKLTESQQESIDEWTKMGLRVLIVAELKEPKNLKNITGGGTVVAAILLQNSLREGVIDTVSFLQKQGVSMRVISGDNPQTVSYIAKSAGIIDSDKTITGAELSDLDDQLFAKAADSHVVFARVLPEQKEKLIAYFSDENKKFTGMIGDGVNDALALKKADLGIAMYAGAPASRRIADAILLDNSFNSLPFGMRVGNQIMQAIEVIATLFFHKIIYVLVLLFITLILGVTYPYAPRHITFLNIFLVTMPTIMWTLFPPLSHHRINPRHFWKDTLEAVAPIAMLTGAAVSAVYLLLRAMHPADNEMVATMTVLSATFFGVYLVFLAGPMLGVILDKQARIARAMYIFAVVAVSLVSFGMPLLRGFFEFTIPTLSMVAPAACIVIAVAIAQLLISIRVGERYRGKNNL